MESKLLYIKYAGTVIERPSGFRFQYVNKTLKYYHSKCFSNKEFKGNDHARIAATEYQKQFSDTNNFTERYYSSSGDEHLRRYLIGFAEGDGCIFVSKTGRLKVTVVQAEDKGIPLILQHFQTVYKGIISKPKKSKTHAIWRTRYHWDCNGFATLPILSDWIQFGTLKREQATMAFEWMMKMQTSNCTPIYQQIKIAKRLQVYRSIEIDDSIITAQYIAGLIDAEGCVSCYHGISITLTIAQKSSTNLLYSINNFFEDLGTVYETKGLLIYTGGHAARILKYLQPHIYWKKEQVDIALKIRKFSTYKRTIDEDLQLQLLQNRLKALKHQ